MKTKTNPMIKLLSIVVCITMLLNFLSFTALASTELTANQSNSQTTIVIDETDCIFTAKNGTVTLEEQTDSVLVTLAPNASVNIAYNGVWSVNRDFVNPDSKAQTVFLFTGIDGINATMTVTLVSGSLHVNDDCSVTVGDRNYLFKATFIISPNLEPNATKDDAVITMYGGSVSFATNTVSVGSENVPATLTVQGEQLIYQSDEAPVTESQWNNTVTDWRAVEGESNLWQTKLIIYYNLWIENQELTSANLQDTDDDQWTWKLIPASSNASHHTLILRNAHLQGHMVESGQYDHDKSAAIFYMNDDMNDVPLVIELVGENVLEAAENRDSWSSAIEVYYADLIIRDQTDDDQIGSLTAKGNLASGSGSSSHNSAGIYVVNNDLTIESGNVVATGDIGERSSCGIYVSGNITINGTASVMATATNDTGVAFGLQTEGGDVVIGGNAVVEAIGETNSEHEVGIGSSYNVRIEDAAMVTAVGKWQAISADVFLYEGDYNVKVNMQGKEQVVHRNDFAHTQEVWYEVTYFKMPYARFAVNVSAMPSEGGSVAGGGSYDAGTSVTVTATANEGYTFIRWQENGQPVCDQPSYEFFVGQQRDLVAVFETTPVQIDPETDTDPDDIPDPEIIPDLETITDANANKTPEKLPDEPIGVTTDDEPSQMETQKDAAPSAESTDVPKTGENSNLFMWFALLFVSGTGVYGMLAHHRKMQK